jgi:hypothetical protein
MRGMGNIMGVYTPLPVARRSRSWIMHAHVIPLSIKKENTMLFRKDLELYTEWGNGARKRPKLSFWQLEPAQSYYYYSRRCTQVESTQETAQIMSCKYVTA